MIVQVALSLVLVIGAALFGRSFAELMGRDLGFDRARVLTAVVDVRRSATLPADRPALYERIRQAVVAVPGVESAATSMATPLGSAGVRFLRSVQEPGNPTFEGKEVRILMAPVSPEWFRTVWHTANRRSRHQPRRSRDIPDSRTHQRGICPTSFSGNESDRANASLMSATVGDRQGRDRRSAVCQTYETAERGPSGCEPCLRTSLPGSWTSRAETERRRCQDGAREVAALSTPGTATTAWRMRS